MDEPDIKQGLFPGQGVNVSTSKGGGKKKIDHQYALARIVFSEHPKYGEAFELAQDSKLKAMLTVESVAPATTPIWLSTCWHGTSADDAKRLASDAYQRVAESPSRGAPAQPFLLIGGPVGPSRAGLYFVFSEK